MNPPAYGDLIESKNERDDVDAEENDKRKYDGNQQIVDLDSARSIFKKSHQRTHLTHKSKVWMLPACGCDISCA